MPDISRLDNSAQEYFFSLPVAIQEQIVQSDLHVTCREDLERYFKNTIGTESNNNPIG